MFMFMFIGQKGTGSLLCTQDHTPRHSPTPNNDHHDVNLEIINVRRHIDVKTSKLLFHLLRVDLGSKNYIICRMIE